MKIVEYKTFIDHLKNKSISDVTIYKFTGEIEVTYKIDDQAYGAKGPFGLNRDPLLQQTLDSNNISYSILREEHPGFKGSFESIAEYSSLLFLMFPLLLVIAIIVQASTIKRLTKLLENQENDRN
ncbi:MAG: hypothetical protein MK188_01365 [Gammaproteobacteria bacterium]|nr:hypothetical protein [Gammaproteobacteria bacterium]